MRLHSFIIIGFCATLALGASVHATPLSNAAEPQSMGSDIVNVAAKSDSAQLKLLKKKKNPTAEDLAEIKRLESKIAADLEAARVKAIEARKLAMREAAKAKAEQERLAFQARKAGGQAPAPETKAAARTEPAKQPQADIPAEAVSVVASGNNGELRSDPKAGAPKRQTGLFAGLFGGSTASVSYLLPETRALDAALAQKDARKPFKVKPEYVPQEVPFSGYSAGTIVINTAERRLYLVESSSTARRYAIAVGREGLQFKGTVAVGDKQEWPRWIPTLEMQQREPAHYGRYKDGMPGGGENPLGARAIYLYDGKKDTHLRIHGTIAPQTIGTSASNGCFRMINEHVMDLYSRVGVGTKVVIL